MSNLALSSAALFGLGATLLVSNLRWFRRIPLGQRLAPPSDETAAGTSVRSAAGARLADAGIWFAALFDSEISIVVMLDRAGWRQSERQFRARQSAIAMACCLTVIAGLLVIGVPATWSLAVGTTAAVVGFGATEFAVHKIAAQRGERIGEELPTVAEQLGMLLASGMSLTGALGTAGQRGRGVCATELRRVSSRVAQGTAVEAALAEWADVSGSSDIRRLVGVLTLHEDTSEIAALVSDEARNARAATHRRLIERIERRNEQVWIPVTVAALVPGAVLLAIPFSDALQGYAVL